MICDVLPCITCGARTTAAAVDLADALVPEADAEHRDAGLAEGADGVDRHADVGGIVRAAGAGRDEDRVGLERLQLGERDRVVAVHDRFGAELTEVLHEVVDERVVVVDHEHPHVGNATGPRPGDRTGLAKVPAVAPTRKSAKPAPPTRRPTKGSRYTPPAPKTVKSSHLWVPVTMFTCLALGVVVIAGNYLELLPGGEVSNNFLLIGLVLLVIGFVLSTFFR